MKILVTGGAGFIGSNFLNFFTKKYPQYEIVNFDKLTYAGNLENVSEIKNCSNYKFVKGDVCDFDFLVELLKGFDAIIHFAAESHVDNSIGNSLVFTQSNVLGTHALLEAARVSGVKKFLHISTDEVYGDILEGSFDEGHKLAPTNPYSASKAAAEMMVQSYIKTYKLPVLIYRANNNYGPYQYPEKIIPRFVTNLLQEKKLPLHSPHPIRSYLHVLDSVKAVDLIFHKGLVGEIYNVGTEDEFSNIEVTRKILDYFGKDASWIEDVTDRPFNDLRYSVDFSKIQKLGWRQEIDFDSGLNKTIQWYVDNPNWWKDSLNI